MLEAKERVRDSLTHKDRTKGKRCVATRNSKEPMKSQNLSSPGNVKASYNSTSQVGTYLFPLPFLLSPTLQLQRGRKQEPWSQEEVSKTQKRSLSMKAPSCRRPSLGEDEQYNHERSQKVEYGRRWESMLMWRDCRSVSDQETNGQETNIFITNYIPSSFIEQGEQE